RLTPSRLVAGVPAGRTRVACPPAQWVTLRHHHEPYVAWEEFWLNQERIEANRTRPTGTPRSGAAFLSSLLSCGHCGYAMVVKYGRRGTRGQAGGFFHGPLREYEGRRDCHNISATTLDAPVLRAVLQTLAGLSAQAVQEALAQERTGYDHQRQVRVQELAQ